MLRCELSEPQRRQVANVRRLLVGDDGGDAASAEPAGSQEAPKGFLLTGMSFLFTWNVGVVQDPDAEWRHFLDWRVQQAVGPFKSIRFSATMEESLSSEDSDRVHIHEQRELCSRLNRASLQPFAYTTTAGVVVLPNCAPNYLEAVGSSSMDGTNRGRGAAYRAACDRAHFYVQANKFGTLFAETDWPLQKKFRVQARWFDDLVARGKLSRDQWLQYAADSTVGFTSRKRNFDALEIFEKAKAIEADSLRLKQQIAEACPKKPWRDELLAEAKASGDETQIFMFVAFFCLFCWFVCLFGWLVGLLACLLGNLFVSQRVSYLVCWFCALTNNASCLSSGRPGWSSSKPSTIVLPFLCCGVHRAVARHGLRCQASSVRTP